MSAGRFAPSPTSSLHVGNLRTAVVAWLLARATGREFRVRIEDLDQARVAAAPGIGRQQLDDLAALGLDWDGPVLRQTERQDAYADALAQLPVYECFCTRREIAEAAQAPNGPDGHRPYPGTCRDLSAAQRAERRRTRAPALRVRADGATVTVRDRYAGDVTGVVDDFVVRRGDGTFAYNLASVVDDAATGVDQVCRADDLLASAPRQAWLATRLGASIPEYAHVGLVTNVDGARLAKRDGAVSLADLAAVGVTTADVVAWIARSLGYAAEHERLDLASLRRRYDPDRPVASVAYCPAWRSRMSTT